MAWCSECNREFSSDSAFQAHCRDRIDHHYCSVCSRFLVDSNALQQHLDSSPIHQYDTHDSDDDDDYSDESEQFHCGACARSFINEPSLFQHLATSSKHNWCFVCSRDFSSATALDQHSSSRVHKAENLKCPLCSKAFKFPSSIALHIESGCHDIHRHQITAAVHSLNVVPTISVSRRLQGIPGTSIQRHAITHFSATEYAFNGYAYGCYLCSRTFHTLTALNTHLNSPAHDADEFQCPKCESTFKLVSGLIQHIESEVCGMMRFKQVEDYSSRLTGQFSKLLL